MKESHAAGIVTLGTLAALFVAAQNLRIEKQRPVPRPQPEIVQRYNQLCSPKPEVCRLGESILRRL